MGEADQEMLDACDSETQLQMKPGLPASSPANGELRNGDAPSAANQEAVLEVKDLEGLATISCACAPNIRGITYFQFFSPISVTNKPHTADRNF
jgi:hypothetical protein